MKRQGWWGLGLGVLLLAAPGWGAEKAPVLPVAGGSQAGTESQAEGEEVSAEAPVPAPITAEVEDLSSRAYLPAALEAIQGAQRSITAAFYEIVLPSQSPVHPVAQLVDALIAAHRRGVEVTVIVNRDQAGHHPLFTRNDTAISALQAAGLSPRVTASSTRLHAKLLIVDNTLVLEGSTNWSYDALVRNAESAILVRSPAYAWRKLAWLNQLPTQPAPAFVAGAHDAVVVPNTFLQDPRFMARMLNRHDTRAFDLALLLYRLHEEAGGQSPTLTVAADVLAKELGMPEGWNRTDTRRQLVKTLRKLERRYQCLWVTAPYGQAYEVTLRDLTDPQKAYTTPRIGYRPIPRAYWTDGWAQRLSLRAKVAYLIALRRAAQSPTSPWFQASQPLMAQAFHLNEITALRMGFRELQREEIVEIVQSQRRPGGLFSDRAPARYRLNGLPNQAALASAWDQLQEAHGAERVAQARALADQLRGEPNDRQMVEAILDLMDRYSPAAVIQVTADLAEYRPDNPFRTVAILRARLKQRHGI